MYSRTFGFGRFDVGPGAGVEGVAEVLFLLPALGLGLGRETATGKMLSLADSLSRLSAQGSRNVLIPAEVRRAAVIYTC